MPRAIFRSAADVIRQTSDGRTDAKRPRESKRHNIVQRETHLRARCEDELAALLRERNGEGLANAAAGARKEHALAFE